MSTSALSPLTQARQLEAMTQEMLSEVSGVSVRTIQRAEAGDNVGLPTLKLLATALNVHVTAITTLNPLQDTSSSELYVFVEEQIRQYRKRTSWRYSTFWFSAFLFLILLSTLSQFLFTGDFFPLTITASLVIALVIAGLVRNKLIEPYLDRKYPLTKTYEPKITIGKLSNRS